MNVPAVLVIPELKTVLTGFELAVVSQDPVVFKVTKPTKVLVPDDELSTNLPLPVKVVVPPTVRLLATGSNLPAISKLTDAPKTKAALN